MDRSAVLLVTLVFFCAVHVSVGQKTTPYPPPVTTQADKKDRGHECEVLARPCAGGMSGMPGANGMPGVPGMPGPHGPRGDQGRSGPKGITGNDGTKGDKGERGDTGPEGPKGDRGSRGLVGSPGKTGPSGTKGDRGSSGAKGDAGAKGNAGSQGAKGDAGEKGDSGVGAGPISAANWKQCVWKNVNDGRDIGKFKECSFNKLQGDTALKVSFQGVMRVYGSGAKCNRWYFKFNGNECSGPMTIEAVVYNRWSSENPNLLHHRSFEGCCENLPRGAITVELWVGACSGYTRGDADTGWNSVSRIMVEEVPRSQ